MRRIVSMVGQRAGRRGHVAPAGTGGEAGWLVTPEPEEVIHAAYPSHTTTPSKCGAWRA
jgi:hypothetical protein